MYAVALAKAMGLVAFLSDDTKSFGPHEILVDESIEDVIPFAFYELLFLKYLSGNLTLEELSQVFEEINYKSMNRHPMNFKQRMLRTVRRFSSRSGTTRDYDWIYAYCKKNNIQYKSKMISLKEYLSQIE
jgi:hypothetical protein